jgi:hypothetical protein
LDSERCTERVCVSAGALAFGLLPNPREERCERHRERLCVKGLGYWRFFFSFFFIIIIFFYFYSWVEMRNLYAWRIKSKLINCILKLR